MSQLIEINGRYYQECEVVMLATDKRSNLQLNVIHKTLFSDKEGAEIPSQPFQHLYIVSNEEIKKGDWYVIVQDSKKGYQVATKPASIEEVSLQNKFNCKKIVASTDKSLSLPQPSQAFIEKYIEEYNKGNVITNVLVEYEFNQHKFMATLCTTKEKEYNLKVDSNNTITIKRLEPELYTREQLENHIRNAMQFKGYTPEYEVQEYCKKYLN